MPPTLLVPGKLIYPDDAIISKFMNQPANEVVPIQFILTWIKRKMFEYSGMEPKYLVDRILILVSKTGSGKSTALPTMTLRILSNAIRKGGSILVTEPRISNAVSIGREQKEVPWNKDIKDMIGIKTGPLRENVKRGLIFATIGVLLAQLKTLSDDKIIEMYRIIILDECHVRDVQTDGVFIKLLQFYQRNITRGIKNLPFLILTSATFDTDKYAKFFGVHPDILSEDERERVREFGCGNMISVTGQTFPVEMNWPQTGTNDYLQTSAEIAIKIHKSNLDDKPGKNDILIFVPGSGEGRTVAMHLNKANAAFRSKESKIPPYTVIYIDSKAISSQNSDYQILYTPHDKLKITSLEDSKILLPVFRRIILSSTAMETGVTVDSLKYVEDCGWNRSSESYFPWGYRGLTTRPATQSMITQRKGRCGRLFPGSFYATYTEKTFGELQENQLPGILTEGSNSIFLDLVLNFSTVQELQMLDLPPADALHYSVNSAIKFGFINGCGPDPKWKITEMGKLASKFSRIEMFEARILFLSYVWGVNLYDMVNIVSIMNKQRKDFVVSKKSSHGDEGYVELIELALSENVFVYFKNEVKSMDAFKLLVSCELIEHSLVLEGFIRKNNEYLFTGKQMNELIEWCEKKSIKYDGMMEILTRREDIINDLIAAGFDPFKSPGKRISEVKIGELFDLICRIKRCLFDGLHDNVLAMENGVYKNKGKKIEVATSMKFDKANEILVGTIRLELMSSKDSREAKPLFYKLVGYNVCVLDGYVDYDETLELPR